ncbi:TRAP transporter substrate-binding protein [Salibacterium qingdaonense]|uniref:TRAP-type C4-dicarboxylate transport system, substrate-binding protein n=1 Tax=Salibacterium qingdaonense TaxID=266892 RepID=A0A1I4KK26_9BACI|nr:TRAP transporter substrate-binding protein [Salibacterium qingdaonense]SFL79098.1 TRAP-type C4-dicarboxylate transport system, substrate-binding protein [Salibacterium qingdaonense]
MKKHSFHMKKAIAAAVLGTSMMAAAGCGSSGAENSSGNGGNGGGESGGSGEGSSQETTEMVAATINPEGSLLANALQALADEIETRSDGAIEFQVATGGQLGNASSLYQSVISGDIDMIYSDSGWFSEHHPEFDALGTNYLFEGEEHYKEVVNSEDSLQYFEDLLVEEPGLKTVMYAGGLERNIISTFPIESIEDLQGKTMRSKNESTELEWWRNLGANPTAVAFDEVYTALQTGVVEGSQNSMDAMIEQRFGEVADYVARTQHNLTLGFVVMNNEQFEALDSDMQDVVMNAAQDVQEEYINKAFEKSEEDVQTLKDEFGVEFTNPDREAFIEASRKQLQAIAEKHGIQDEIDDIFGTQ